MQILFPMGGRGTRVRPHTHVRPKPLMVIAGKSVLEHIIDYLAPLEASEYIFITNPGAAGEQVRAAITAAYPHLNVRFIVQEEPKGQAQAVSLAEPYVREPLLIVFIDTLFEADLAALKDPTGDGVVLTHPVEHPERFGVVITEGGRIVRFVEKPATPVSHDGLAGVYVFTRPARLFGAIRTLMERGETRGGEFYLADAAQVMADEGATLVPLAATVWQDTGTIEAILGTGDPAFNAHHYLLEKNARMDAACDNSVVIPPVFIPASATISESVIGPYVSVGEGAVIRRSIVRESIVGGNALIDRLHLVNSIVGPEATATGRETELNISDHSNVQT